MTNDTRIARFNLSMSHPCGLWRVACVCPRVGHGIARIAPPSWVGKRRNYGAGHVDRAALPWNMVTDKSGKQVRVTA